MICLQRSLSLKDSDLFFRSIHLFFLIIIIYLGENIGNIWRIRKNLLFLHAINLQTKEK
jgi:hypothetical protein